MLVNEIARNPSTEEEITWSCFLDISFFGCSGRKTWAPFCRFSQIRR